MTFNKLAVDHPGMAGRQARWNPEALFDRTHIGFHVIVDGKTVVLQVADPGLAATAVGIAVYLDGQRFGGETQVAEQQRGKHRQLAHGGLLAGKG